MSQSDLPVHQPSRYVPLAAVATRSASGNAEPISPANPIPCSEMPLASVRALVADTVIEPGLALLVDCSTGGMLNLELADGTQLPLAFAPGLTLLPFAVRQRLSLGTTAIDNAWVLD